MERRSAPRQHRQNHLQGLPGLNVVQVLFGATALQVVYIEGPDLREFGSIFFAYGSRLFASFSHDFDKAARPPALASSSICADHSW